MANATRRLRVITHTDLTCAHANLDLSQMGMIVHLVSKAVRFLLNSAMRFFFGLLFVDVYFGNVASHVLILQNR